MVVNKIPKWPPPIARLSLSAGFLLVAWLLATCGAPSGPPSDRSTGGEVLVEYWRTGGIAGLDDHLVIRANGEAALEQKGGQQETFTLDQSTLSSLQQTLNEAGFFELDSQYRPPRTIPDAFQYRITYQREGRRHTVETTDGAVPEELVPVLDELNQIIAQH